MLASCYLCIHALYMQNCYKHPTTTDYRLVIICSNEDEDKSHLISRLSTHRKQFTTLHDVSKFQEYLKSHFTTPMPTHQRPIVTKGVAASTVDFDQ